jgi:UBX domain
MQKEREQKQRDERERIKLQIKADREERRRLEQIQRLSEAAAKVEKDTPQKPAKSNNIRVQVRMFDGGTQRRTFPPSATISRDVRSWIDSLSEQSTPYNLTIILTPLPNRSIETGEEEQSLTDLGIKGSCTLVMVPVKGYVDSYAEAAPSLIGSAVSGGYNLVAGTAGAVFGGVKSVLGYGSTAQNQQIVREETSNASTSAPKVKVRTLADQRAEEAKKDQQFYNGNQLNFQPRKDEDEGKKD